MGDVYLMKLSRKALLFFSFLLFSQAHPKLHFALRKLDFLREILRFFELWKEENFEFCLKSQA